VSRLRAATPGLLLLLGLWFAAAVVAAAPASAHAVLLSTDPEEGARLTTAPRQVTLRFDEEVTFGAGYARVLTVSGERADTGSPVVRGDTMVIPLRDGLPDTGYVVTYRVASDDAHPVVGTFSFVVGTGPAVPVAPGVEAAGTDPAVTVGLAVARWVTFAGLAVAIGAPVLALCRPDRRPTSRLRRLTAGGLAGLLVGTAAAFLLQGPYVAGSGLGSALRPALLRATTETEYGMALLVRLGLGALLAVVLVTGRGRTPGRGRVALAGAAALALVFSVAAVGHPVAGPWPGLAVPVAAIHVAAMAVWLGGLVALLTEVVRRDTPSKDLAAVLPRFSRVAFVSIAALVLTGAVQAVREVGSVAELVQTTYGRVLLVKVVLVLAILVAAAFSRGRVRRRFGGAPRRSRRVLVQAFAATGQETAPAVPESADRRALRRSVLAECVLGVVVLALSAVLGGSPPARAAYLGPLDVTLPLQGAGAEGARVRVVLDPGRPGPDVLRLDVVDRAGRPVQPLGARVTLTEKEQQIGPTDVWLQPAGTGRYVSTRLTVPVAGTWTVDVTVGLGGLATGTATAQASVR
jgi:copper transport protein